MIIKYFLIAIIAMALCLFFIFVFPNSVGDGTIYMLVANNILNGCGVSMSELGGEACIPHFGGNQGPGYPAFIALIWSFSGHSNLAVRLVQATLYVISIIYLVHALRHHTKSLNQALVVGFILAVSPLHMAWSRFILTETLTLAGTLWVFAELVKSFDNCKLRVFPIGLALIAATFIRLDAILLVIPIALTAFMIHRPFEAFKRGLVISLVLAIPWFGWLARNAHVGLDNIFKPVIVEIFEESPGIFNWTRTWSTTQYSSNAVHYPVYNLAYDEIRINNKAYSSQEEMKAVNALIKELQNFINKPFPKHIDNQFAVLAENRKFEQPFKFFFIVPMKRIINFWFYFNAGYGWPEFGNRLSAQDRLDLSEGGYVKKLQLVKDYPIIATGRIITQIWKLLLYLGFGLSLWLTFKNKALRHRKLVFLVLSFIVVRSYLAGYMNIVEARYSIMQMPLIELMVALVFTEALSNWRANRVVLSVK